MRISIRKPAVVLLFILLITTLFCFIYFQTPQYVNVKKTYVETLDDINDRLDENRSSWSSTGKIYYDEKNQKISENRYETGVLMERYYYDNGALFAIDKFDMNTKRIKREYYDEDRLFSIDYFEHEKLTVTDYYDNEGNLEDREYMWVPPAFSGHGYP